FGSSRDPLDSDADQARKIAGSHQRYCAGQGQDLPRMGRKGSPGRPSGDTSGPSSDSASTPKRGRR
ncbi:hypothetical protein ABZ800_35910, partial [Streptomyces sp. NPDC047813]|uniref:hypothetical protein n=1 Tax=Streptomyces sp. NPDC047813 TaxID=3154608 RepID=UPI0033F0A432